MYMLKKNKGMTLVELMVAVAILGIFAASMGVVLSKVNKGIDSTKARTIANNLSQEKVEKLKDYNYYKLIATPVAALSDPNDSSNPYPPETISISGVSFTRTTVIKKLTETAGSLVEVAPTDPDDGIKKIEITIGWTQNNVAKSVMLTNLVQNPGRTSLTGIIMGNVKDLASANVSGAHVYVSDNPNRDATTDVSGNYSIIVAPGAFTVRVDKKGYVSQTSGSLTATAGVTITQNFTALTLRTNGTSTGYVFKRDHLIISEVCAKVAVADFDEYVELYNSSSTPVTISSGNFQLKYVDSSDVINNLSLTWVDNIVPAYGFFLIGRTPNISGVASNAYWNGVEVLEEIKCGVIIADNSGAVIDKVGWGKPGSSMPAPPNAVEVTGVDLSATGLDAGRVIERKPYPGVTAPSASGNAFDSDDNSVDFANHTTLSIQNASSSAEVPTGGSLALGAYVFADDDLSSATTASTSTGTYTLSNIATGTWKLSGASAALYGEVTNVTITSGTTITNNIILDSVSTNGYIEGKVVNSTSTALASIAMNCGGVSASTDSLGAYKFVVPEGVFFVEANYGNANPNYTSSSSTALTVIPGSVFNLPDFVLVAGGSISGKITTNGTDAIPNVYVVAKDFGNIERGNAITDSSGNYVINNLAVSGNAYSVFPALDDKEVSSPTSMVSNVTAGTIATNFNFQVTTALGSINGVVRNSSNALITTGVLVVALPSPSVIGSLPPTVDATLRGGSDVYYTTTSDSNGSYSLSVRGSATGSLYNVYGWYTDNIGTTTKCPATGTSSTTITGNASGTVNFTF